MCSSADARSIEKIPERSLRFVLYDFTSEYGVLMEKSSKSALYLERLRQLCVVTYKATNGLAPAYVSDIFYRKIHIHSYSLRDKNTLSLCKFNTIKYGKLSLRYEAANIWNKLPPSFTCVPCLDDFKKSIKTWKGPLCMCGSMYAMCLQAVKSGLMILSCLFFCICSLYPHYIHRHPHPRPISHFTATSLHGSKELVLMFIVTLTSM